MKSKAQHYKYCLDFGKMITGIKVKKTDENNFFEFNTILTHLKSKDIN